MESPDILILAVEAALALAGFAGIIATFQFGVGKETRRGDAVGLTMILQLSLLAALHSSVTLLMYSFGLQESTLWTASSLVGVLLNAWGIYSYTIKVRPAIRTTSGKLLATMLQIPVICVTLILALNASDTYFHREPGPVIASILLALSVTGFLFARLLLRPIWRNVREQEAANAAHTVSD